MEGEEGQKDRIENSILGKTIPINIRAETPP